MDAYPDTSFLFAVYTQRAQTIGARAHLASMKEPLPVASLLRYEFFNAIRYGAFRKEMSVDEAMRVLASFEADMDAGRVVIPPVAWERVHHEAERLSNTYTLRHGHRSFDILHVATALTLGAKQFLSFDTHQRKLAAAEGLKIKP